MAITSNQGASQEIIDAAQATASSSAVSTGYMIIGIIIVSTSILALAIKFSTQDEEDVAKEIKSSIQLALDK